MRPLAVCAVLVAAGAVVVYAVARLLALAAEMVDEAMYR